MDDVLAMDAMQEARDSVCDDGAASEAWWQNTKPCPRCGAPMRTNLDYVANAAGNDYLPCEIWISSGSCMYFEEVTRDVD